MPTKKATSEKQSSAKQKPETTESKTTAAQKKSETTESKTATAQKTRVNRRTKTAEASATTAADKPKPVRKSKSSTATATAGESKKTTKAAAKATKKPAEPAAEKPAESTAETKAPARKVEAANTTIVVRADVGYGNHLYLRGEGGELSWEKGIPMQNVSPDEWSWSTSAEDPVTFKLLINDEIWSAGDNFTVTPGDTSVVEPAF